MTSSHPRMCEKVVVRVDVVVFSIQILVEPGGRLDQSVLVALHVGGVVLCSDGKAMSASLVDFELVCIPTTLTLTITSTSTST